MDFDSELKKIPFEDQEIDMEQLYCFTEALEQAPNKREAVPAIFRFFEANSDKFLGSPGPLVHFLEKENDYLIELEKSVLRKPTNLTIWIINRIINAAEPKDRERWLSIMAAVICHPEADAEAIQSAKEFIDYQSENI
jgi:hypothetical protein